MSAIAAVLQRDLRGAERSGLLASARVLALAGAGLTALGGYSSFGATGTADRPTAAAAVVGGLMLLSLLLGASLAQGAFRSERRAGTLDLMLLSGLSPRSLGAGRILSTFLVLQSVALAAAPALALFWFFRTPSPRSWLLHALALSSFNLAVAAIGVVISAWTRRSRTALAASLVLLPAFAVLSMLGPGLRTWSAPGLVLQVLARNGDLDASRAFLCLGFHGALAGACLLLAELGLGRRQSAAILGGSLPAGTAPAPSPRRPLRWLMHRSSPASRPASQALAFALILALAAVSQVVVAQDARDWSHLLEPELLSTFGGGFALIAIAVALAAGATRIATERERGTWEVILSAGAPSRGLAGDLIASTLSCCVVPVVAASGLLSVAALRSGTGLLMALLATFALGASVLLAAALGLAASACARNTTTALALSCLLLIGLPSLVAGGSLLRGGEDVLDVGNPLGLLVFVALMPLLVRGVGPFVLLGVQVWRARRRRGGPASLILRPLAVLAILAVLAGGQPRDLEEQSIIALGAAYSSLTCLITSGAEPFVRDPTLALAGAAWQGLFGLLVILGILGRSDLWLGRASS